MSSGERERVLRQRVISRAGNVSEIHSLLGLKEQRFHSILDWMMEKPASSKRPAVLPTRFLGGSCQKSARFLGGKLGQDRTDVLGRAVNCFSEKVGRSGQRR